GPRARHDDPRVRLPGRLRRVLLRELEGPLVRLAAGMTGHPASARPPVRGGSLRASWSREERLALAALSFVLMVSAAWWAVALWPLPEAAPGWLQTARAVCFGARDAGLPSAGGWILLVGEPLGMLAAVFVVWRGAALGALRRLAAGRGG